MTSPTIVEMLVENGIKKPEYRNGVYKVFAASSGVVSPNSGGRIPIGFKLRIPQNYFGCIQKSTPINALAGVVDSDYRGELCVIMHNDSDNELKYEKDQEVAELCVYKIITPEIEEIAL